MPRPDLKKASKPQSLKASKDASPKKYKDIKDITSQLPSCLRKGAVAVTGIYLCTTTLGCAPFYFNGAKLYDPDPKENKKIYASADNTGTDGSIGEKVSWYKTTWGIIGITAAVILVGTVAGFAIYNHNKKDADPPPASTSTTTTPAPAPPPSPL